LTGVASAGPQAGIVPPPWTERVVQRLREYSPAVVVFFGGLVVWELAIRALGLATFILPPPSAIFAALTGPQSAELTTAAKNTLIEAVGGLAMGVTAGVVVGFATARWGGARDALLPIAIAANAVPIVAFAPIVNNWFGVLNPLSKAVIVAVLVFFPVMINVVRGLTQVDASAIELMRSYAATEWQVLRRLRLPNALPYFFTALKISSTLSLIGAIVGEYFGGSSEVLGRVIVKSASSLSFDVTWAAIFLGAAAGIGFYLVIVAVERIVIPWHASQRAATR
jgi:NitT/TauT family transport system permease protein